MSQIDSFNKCGHPVVIQDKNGNGVIDEADVATATRQFNGDDGKVYKAGQEVPYSAYQSLLKITSCQAGEVRLVRGSLVYPEIRKSPREELGNGIQILFSETRIGKLGPLPVGIQILFSETGDGGAHVQPAVREPLPKVSIAEVPPRKVGIWIEQVGVSSVGRLLVRFAVGPLQKAVEAIPAWFMRASLPK